MQLRRLFAGLVILAGVLGLISLVVLGFTAREVDRLAVEQRRAHLVTQEVSALLSITHEYVVHRDARAEQQWRKRYATFMQVLGLDVSSVYDNSGTRPELRDALQALPGLFDGLVGASLSGAQDPQTLKRSEFLIDGLLTETQAIAQEASQWESRATGARTEIERRLIVLAISLPALLALLFAGAAWLLARRILKPIGSLQNAMAIAAAGDLTVRCDSGAPDEVGDLARGFDHMANELQSRTQAIRGAEAFLRNITDNLPVRIAYVDRELRYRFVNERCCERFALPREDIVGHTIEELRGSSVDPAIASQVSAVLAGETRKFEFTEEVGGRAVCIESNLVPDIAPDGTVRGFVSTGVDITEPQRQRAEIERALKEKEVLLSEIHHRVKNNMQVISSLLQLQSRYIENPAIRELLAESQNRISSMALIHEKLYQRHDFSEVDFADYVQSLVSMLRTSQGDRSMRAPIDVSTAPMMIDIDRAIPAGLILNELVSNCFKHGFPDGRSGRIDVTLAPHGDDEVMLAVRDDGISVAAGFDPSTTRSLGLQLVHILADQLEASLTFGYQQGFACELVFSSMASPPPRWPGFES